MVYFYTKNPNFGTFLRTGIENVDVFKRPFLTFYVLGIICGHLVNLWSFGIFFKFWYVVPIKIWQPCLDRARLNMNDASDGQD
jgi:hypothetical protein